LDCGNPQQALSSLNAAKTVVALSAFKDGVMQVADIVLPISPYTETSGTYINCEGRMQTTVAVVRPLGQARPAWKVLRVLGNLLGNSDFEFESSEEIRAEVLGDREPGKIIVGLSARAHPAQLLPAMATSTNAKLIRIADVPIYRSDVVSRHAPALQETRASAAPKALMNPADVSRLGLASGAKVKCTQYGRHSEILEIASDSRVAIGVVQISAAHRVSAGLGDMIGPIEMEAA
jgi:NADH-quinone oxidoreductase subunit G